MPVCLHMCVCNVYTVPKDPKWGPVLGTGVMGSCELQDTGARTEKQMLLNC